jgi:hypothetical protein
MDEIADSEEDGEFIEPLTLFSPFSFLCRLQRLDM